MKRFIPVLLIGLLLSACFSSQTAKRYFQLQLGNDAFSSGIKLGKIIMIDSVQSKQLYDDFRIIYRISPYEINYYSYDFWAKRPAKLILDAIVDYLSRSQIFVRVDEKLTRSEPDLLMKVILNLIEEVDIGASWYGRLSLDIKIENFKTGEVIMIYNFDRKKKLPSKKAIHLPRTISRILQEELKKMIEILIHKIDQLKSNNVRNTTN